MSVTTISPAGVVTVQAEGCNQRGVFAHNGKHLLVAEGYAADSASTFVRSFRCPLNKMTFLRQRQRDDSFNAPRAWGAHNNPTSRQYSLRSYPGGNTYLRTDLLAGCDC